MIRKKTCLILMVIIFSLTLLGNMSLGQPQTFAQSDIKAIVDQVMSELNMSNIKEHVKELSTHGSRFVGYKGYEFAANYIFNYFNKLGFNTWIWKYKIVIPYDDNSTLTITSPVRKTFRVYALMPNLVQTCRGVYEGELVYVGEGNLKDISGINVTGKIVLMKYNTKYNWMYFMNLGAKAVIFIEPTMTVRGEGDYKIADVPLKFPRVMISRNDASYLIRLLTKGKVYVKLHVNMFWKEIYVKDIFALIPGRSGDMDDIIMIACHYDAYSVVPALTPAADEACGVAALLEYARYLSKHPPYRTVLLAAFGGYAMGMAGARYFCEDLFYDHWNTPKIANGTRGIVELTGDQIKMVLVFDFSTDSSSIALVTQGTFYGGFDWTRVGNIVSLINYLYRIGTYYLANYTYEIGGKKYRVFLSLMGLNRIGLPSQVNHLGEVFLHVNIFAMTFYTAEASRIFWETPTDTINIVKFANLKPQVELAFILTSILLNDPRQSTLNNIIRGIMHGHSRSAPLGFALLRGRACYYNWSKVWYDNNWKVLLSKNDFIIVYVRLLRLRRGKHYFITIADRNTGIFEIPGVKPSGWALGAYPYEILVFVMNNKTSNIEWAPDLGLYGTRLWPHGLVFTLREASETSGRRLVNVVLFKCGVAVLHDCIDPRTLTTPLIAEIRPLAIKLYDSRSKAQLVQYGYYVSVPPSPLLTAQLIARGIGDPALGYDAVIFLPPDTPTDIIFTTTKGEMPLGVIRGIKVGAGQYKDISITALQFAKVMINLTYERLKRILNEPILTGSVTIAKEYYDNAVRSFNESLLYLKSYDYSDFYPRTYRAWYFARKAYEVVSEVYTNIVYTGVTLIVLLIPLALILERLLFEKKGLQRIVTIIVLYAILFAIAYLIHPGLRVVYNTLMASLSIITFLLTLPVLGFVIVGVISVAKEIRKRVIGLHFVDVSRLSILSAAIGIGVGNLKKRPLRTALTLTVIILMITSLVLCTSWTFKDVPKLTPLPLGGKPPYKGILIKIAGTEESRISSSLIEFMEGYFGKNAIVAPRAWLLSPASGGGFYAYSDKCKSLVFVKAIVGLTPDEPLPLRKALKYGNWFRKGDMYKAIITDDLAKELNVTIGDRIYVAGISLTVIDILYRNIFVAIKDIDCRYITPRDPNAPPGSPIQTKDMFIIIPYRLAIRVGGIVSSVAVYYPNATQALKKAEKISEQLTYLAVYYSDGKHGYLVTWIRSYELMGAAELTVPLVITIFILLNTMITAIYERINEIKIYSALGLSPMHVATMIFSEGFVYAIMGAAIGYMISLIIGYVISLIYPGLYLVNYASPYPLISIFLSMLAVILAGIYPALKASTFVTPSLRRKWTIPTKPIGNEWYIPLPVSFHDEREVYGVMCYLDEYFRSMSLEKFRIEGEPRFERRPNELVALRVLARLPPYDAGIIEDARIIATRGADGRIHFGVYAKMLSGKLYLWVPSHRNFVDVIRKQLLLWRGLRSSDKKKYLKLGEKIRREIIHE